MGEFPPELAFSGASGGALVAGALSTGIMPTDVADYAIESAPACTWSLTNTFKSLDNCLDKFLPKDATDKVSGQKRLRVLMTQFMGWKPPFFKGKAVHSWTSWDHLRGCLRASCHIPILAGWKPFFVKEEGSYFYDGLAWLSFLVDWRAFSPKDRVVRVSSVSMPNADIGPSRMFPPWWCVRPPSQDVLRGIFWCGYVDAIAYFSKEQTVVRRGGIFSCAGLRRPLRDIDQLVPWVISDTESETENNNTTSSSSSSSTSGVKNSNGPVIQSSASKEGGKGKARRRNKKREAFPVSLARSPTLLDCSPSSLHPPLDAEITTSTLSSPVPQLPLWKAFHKIALLPGKTSTKREMSQEVERLIQVADEASEMSWALCFTTAIGMAGLCTMAVLAR